MGDGEGRERERNVSLREKKEKGRGERGETKGVRRKTTTYPKRAPR
jgi:hypothetical protein